MASYFTYFLNCEVGHVPDTRSTRSHWTEHVSGPVLDDFYAVSMKRVTKTPDFKAVDGSGATRFALFGRALHRAI